MAIKSYTTSIEVNGTNKFIVTLDRSDGLIHAVSIKVGSYRADLLNYSDKTSTEKSYVIPMAWLSAIPDSPTGKGVMYIDTYTKDNTPVSTEEKPFTIIVPASCKPSVQSLAAYVYNSHTALSGLGVGVYGYSRARLVPEGLATSYGSPITSYTLVGDGITSKIDGYDGGEIMSNPFRGTGDISYTLKVTDARGRTSEEVVSNPIAVRPYTRPLITLADVYRCDANNNKSNSGKYMRIVATSTISDIVSDKGESANSLKLYAFWQDDGGGSGMQELTSGVGVTIGIDTDKTYTVDFVARDILQETRAYRTVPCENVAIFVKKGGKSVGIGKYVSGDNRFDVAFNSHFDGTATFYKDTHFSGKVSGAVQSYGSAERIATYTTSGGSTYYADFDDYTSFGVWGVYSNADAANILNIPTAKAGILRVFSATGEYTSYSGIHYIIQEYMLFDATAVYRRYCFYDGSSWSYNTWHCYKPTN